MNDESAIEPELRAAPPRLVRATWRVRMLQWFFLTLTILAPLAMIGFAVKAQRDWTALREHGAKTVGAIAEKRARTTGKNESPPRARFKYTVDGAEHEVWENLTDDEYRNLLLGATKEITYLPEHPGTATTTDKLAKDGDTSTTAFALSITAGLVSLIGLPFWIWISRQHRRARRLLTLGRAVRTTSVVVEVSRASRNYAVVRFEFPHEGETKSGKTYVESDIGAGLGTPGAAATVLYDPEDPQRCDLYAPLARQYRIEPPQLQF